MNYKKLSHQDSQGNISGVVTVEQQMGSDYVLKYSKPERRLPESVWRNLFEQAKIEGLQFGAKKIGCRLRKDYDVEIFSKILFDLDFIKKSERIEYKLDLNLLPNDVGTPFHWKTAQDLSWSKRQIADFVSKIIEGAPDTDPNENPEEFIEDFLSHNEFTSGPDCIGIGFLNDVACALVVAQIEVKSGWSRLSYMGLMRAYRGKNLGKWVHRHGFEMMRSQGGTLYHGGTLTNNYPMRKLFENHRCHVIYEMSEWQLRLNDGAR